MTCVFQISWPVTQGREKPSPVYTSPSCPRRDLRDHRRGLGRHLGGGGLGHVLHACSMTWNFPNGRGHPRVCPEEELLGDRPPPSDARPRVDGDCDDASAHPPLARARSAGSCVRGALEVIEISGRLFDCYDAPAFPGELPPVQHGPHPAPARTRTLIRLPRGSHRMRRRAGKPRQRSLAVQGGSATAGPPAAPSATSSCSVPGRRVDPEDRRLDNGASHQRFAARHASRVRRDPRVRSARCAQRRRPAGPPGRRRTARGFPLLFLASPGEGQDLVQAWLVAVPGVDLEPGAVDADPVERVVRLPGRRAWALEGSGVSAAQRMVLPAAQLPGQRHVGADHAVHDADPGQAGERFEPGPPDRDPGCPPRPPWSRPLAAAGQARRRRPAACAWSAAHRPARPRTRGWRAPSPPSILIPADRRAADACL